MSKSLPSSTPGCVCPNCGRKFSGAIGHHARKCGVTPAQLFWAKVNKTAECWIWTGSIKPRNGYGNVMILGKNYNAHRWAYSQEHGLIPRGMEVMHTCDVPACVNPAHMKLGTHVENMKDCKEKGRHSKGETNTHAKLTESQVLEIRANPPKLGRGLRELDECASKYGMSKTAIYCAMTGRTWKHIQ